MPREILTIQVGQCGNQIGMRFWDLALKEHASCSTQFDDAMSSFFKSDSKELKSLKARALLVDMEEGVINQIYKSEIGELFDSTQTLKDVSGSGNNWAHGHHEYGPKYEKDILEKIQKNLEECDSPQCFMLMHSLGGGTGSGLGTYILEKINDYYPEIYKFDVSVFPSEDDDVITSPYNSILSLDKLINNADCVMPIDNQSLLDICSSAEQKFKEGEKKHFSTNNVFDFNAKLKVANKKTTKEIKDDVQVLVPDKKKIYDVNNKKPFDKMNSLVAHLLCNVTCSMRFEGSLNVDINDITMNLVPYPRMHFLLSSVSPLYHVLDSKLEPRKLDQIFADVFDKNFQLISVDNLYSGIYLASALIARGKISISDINRNITKQRKNLKMVHWNHEDFKIGLCDQPPVNMNYGLLCLSNNTVIADSFQRLANRFLKIYSKKAHVHHYTNYMDKSCFDNAISNVQMLINEYVQVGIPRNVEVEDFKLKPIV